MKNTYYSWKIYDVAKVKVAKLYTNPGASGPRSHTQCDTDILGRVQTVREGLSLGTRKRGIPVSLSWVEMMDTTADSGGGEETETLDRCQELQASQLGSSQSPRDRRAWVQI